MEVKARQVRVKGPRGVLTRDFKHLSVDMYLVEEEGQKKLKVGGWGGWVSKYALCVTRWQCVKRDTDNGTLTPCLGVGVGGGGGETWLWGCRGVSRGFTSM